MGYLRKARLVVTGRVQGVFYRQSTREAAQALGLAGWVRNQPDGTVVLEAIGPLLALERLIAWCQEGPPAARVDRVEIEWSDPAAGEEKSSFQVVG